jgi:hypothetical protein
MTQTLGARLARGAAAGAVGTTALNAVTYLDMVLRGRPASSTPEDTVERLLRLVRIPLPSDGERRAAAKSGLGALLGTVAGVTAGSAVAALRATGHPRDTAGTFATSLAVAMLVGNGPMVVLGVTDPRSWSRTDWWADVVPHVAYAAAATTVLV